MTTRVTSHRLAVNAGDKALLFSFKAQRNPIEHFALNHSREALEALSAIVLGKLIDFISEAYDSVPAATTASKKEKNTR